MRAEAELPGLLRRLDSRWPSERERAARALAGWGPAAVPALCEALGDPEESVRLAAAGALGESGDARAVGPLREALDGCMPGRSAGLQMVVGYVLVPLGLLALCLAGIRLLEWSEGMLAVPPVWVALVVVTSDGGAQALGQFLRSPTAWYRLRRRRGRAATVYAAALASIAERRPGGEVKPALPALRLITVDVLHHDRETRRAVHSAIRRIQGAKGRRGDLPIAASGEVTGGTLPRPSSERHCRRSATDDTDPTDRHG